MLYLDQQNHLDKMLKRLNKTTILHKKLCPTNKIEIKEMENVPYAQAVGRLMYTLISTRPDISHAMGAVIGINQIQEKYIGKQFKELWDFVSGIDGKKLTSGNVSLFGGIIVSSLSKKQPCVTKSTMKVEYMSCSTTVGTVVWAKKVYQ